MKRVYLFTQSTMNGMVTMRTDPVVCTTEELAAKVRDAVIEANKDTADNNNPIKLSCHCSEVVQGVLYESEDEVPILTQESIQAVCPK